MTAAEKKRSIAVTWAPVLLLANFSVSSGLAQREEPKLPSFHQEVRLLVLDAQVIERGTGKPVAGLTSADFEVRINGIPTELVAVDPSPSTLDCLFLIDAGASARGARRELLRALGDSRSFLRDGDRLSAAVFQQDIVSRLAFSEDHHGFLKDLRELVEQFDTRIDKKAPLLDIIEHASAEFPADNPERRRRALLLFGDDRSGGSQTRPGDVLADLLERAVTFHVRLTASRKRVLQVRSRVGPRGFPPVWTSERKVRGLARKGEPLGEIIAETGGALLSSSASDELGDALSALRRRYTVSARMPHDLSDALRVEVNLSSSAKTRHPGVIVRAWRLPGLAVQP